MKKLFLTLFLPSVFLFAQNVPVELWFDENSGGETSNQGTGNVRFCKFRSTATSGDGVTVGPLWSDSVKFDYSGNHSIYFRGDNDNVYLGTGDYAGLELQNFTTEAWVKPEEKTSASHQYILLGRNATFNIRFAFRLTKGEIGWRLVGIIYDVFSTPVILSSEDGSITLDQWQHVAMSYDLADSARLYLNGVQVASAGAFGEMQALSGEWIVSHATSLAFKGWIEDLRISDFARIPGDGSGTGNSLAWDGTLYSKIARFSANTNIVNFGRVEVDSSRIDSVIIQNSGNDNLVISSVESLAPQFGITPDSATIAPGEYEAFVIIFTPDRIREIEGKLVFSHNGEPGVDTLFAFGYGEAVIDTAERIFTKTMPWGQVIFYQGFPRSLVLSYGSGEDMLPGLMDDREFGGVEYVNNDIIYSTVNDIQSTVTESADTVTFQGYLRNIIGETAPDSVTYRLTWIVDPSGYLKLVVHLDSNGIIEQGSVIYRFPIDGTRLNRYYYTGFEPNTIRWATSLKHEPMDEINALGEIFQFDDYVLGRIFGFLRSETEALNICIGSGFIESVEFSNFPPAVLCYTDSTPVSCGDIYASFYILPAPTREINTLKRIYTSVTRPTDIAGTVEAFADTLEKYGFTEYIYLHKWRSWNFTDFSTEVSWVVTDPYLDELVTELHERGIKISLYINLLPEEHSTVWYQNHNGGQYATEHPFNDRRDIMDLNSPFYEHRLRDLDYVLDTLNCDGVYIDWYTMLGCTLLHPYHPDIPATNIRQLIDMIKYVHSKNKIISIHSGEEGRIPFVEELSDYVVCGERSWSRVNYESTESGICDRWTKNRGYFNLILDSRYGYSDAENREEINAALLEGLNPFGWAYRSLLYGIPSSVTATEFHDQYVFDLLAQLKPYNVEELTIYTENEQAAQTSDMRVGVMAMADQDTLLLYAVNKDYNNTISTSLILNPDVLSVDLQRIYGVLDLSTGEVLGEYSGSELIDTGIPVSVTANTCKILYLGDIVQSSIGNDTRVLKHFSLLQNYPNPFNPITTIRYAVPKVSDVKINVYNIRGEQIFELLSEKKQPGMYSIHFDASALASGIYFYHMKAGDFQATRKLVLLK